MTFRSVVSLFFDLADEWWTGVVVCPATRTLTHLSAVGPPLRCACQFRFVPSHAGAGTASPDASAARHSSQAPLLAASLLQHAFASDLFPCVVDGSS